MDEKKKLVKSDTDTEDDCGWGGVLLLSLFLLLEAAAFASVTVWQEESLQGFTQKIDTGNCLLAELERACTEHEDSHHHSEQEDKHDDVSRVRRQSLTDLFHDLLNAQEQVLMSVCVQHPDLCQLGPKGATGDQGDTGPAGIQGPLGDIGPDGLLGNVGQPGPAGEPGSLGQPGPQGVKGDTGITGPRGHKGDMGSKGAPGGAGQDGPVGQAGTPGDKGQSGSRGAKGAPGLAGATGPKGEMGDAGAQGPQGDVGMPGPKGSQLEGDCFCVDLPTVSGNFTGEETVGLHQPLTLHCDASDPSAHITWQRLDGPLTDNVKAPGSDIIFTSITDAEAGVYECKASSTYGEAHKQVEIKLQAPSPYDCDFELDKCSWTDVSNGDTFDWTRLKGPTPSGLTGPKFDHTIGNDQGFYVFIEASNRVNGDNAQLKSTTMNPSQAYCLTFWYHLFGTSLGSLKVRLSKSGTTGAFIWRVTGPSEDRWKQAAVTIPPQNTPFSVIIEGVVGTSYTGDIAVDDIVVLDSPCP